MKSNGGHQTDQAMWIVGAEVCTPLGVDAATSQAEVLAGTLRFADTEVNDLTGEPARACRLSLIAENVSRTKRMTALAAMAFRNHLEATAGLHLGNRMPLPVMLALPESGTGAGKLDERELQISLKSVAAKLMPDATLEFPQEGSFAHGRAAFFKVLANGLDLLRSGKRSAVVIGAVDSLCDPVSLKHWAQGNRILGGGNSDGIIPGEAAGFALLLPPTPVLPRATPVLGLLGVSLAQEAQHFYQEGPNLADGLTSAFRNLRGVAGIGNRRVNHLLSCQTGESFWGEEFSKAYLRNASLMPEPLNEDLVAATFGDVGAASGAVQLQMAFHHASRIAGFGQQVGGISSHSRSRTAPRVLIYGCSDFGLVGACVVEGIGVERWQPLDTTGRRRTTVATVQCLVGEDQDMEPPSHANTSAQSMQEMQTSIYPLSGPPSDGLAAIDALATEFAEEHVAEIGFLLDQRQVYFEDPDGDWSSAGALDERILRHFRAFEAWGAPAMRYACEKGLTSEDEDELRGAVFVLASQVRDKKSEPGRMAAETERKEWSALQHVLEKLVDAKDDDLVAAWVNGAKLAYGELVGKFLEPFLSSQRGEVRAIAADIMGYRREGDGRQLCILLQRLLEQAEEVSSEEWAAVAMGLARLEYAEGRPLLEKALGKAPDGAHTAELIYALACLGNAQALDFARKAVISGAGREKNKVPPGMYQVLGLGATESDLKIFMALQPENVAEKRALCSAMGILGMPDFVPALVERLRLEEDPGIRLAAAEALQRITGAGLRESVRANEGLAPWGTKHAGGGGAEIDAERDPDGWTDGYGSTAETVERASTEAEAWAAWWGQRREAFDTGLRYRHGRPFVLQSCVDEAKAKTKGVPQGARTLAMRELALRCGRDLGFEANWWVERQRRSLQAWSDWCKETGNVGKE